MVFDPPLPDIVHVRIHQPATWSYHSSRNSVVSDVMHARCNRAEVVSTLKQKLQYNTPDR